MKKKGFTLIELLAVIVILAIIALIAVPVIMNIISSARKNAFEDTAYGLISAGEMYYASALLNDGMSGDTEFTIENGEFTGENKLDVKGSLPESGTIKVSKEGKVALAITNGSICIKKGYDDSDIETLEEYESCELPTDILKPGTLAYLARKNDFATSIDACATSGACQQGTKFAIEVAPGNIQNFYVVSDVDNVVTLIMDRNIGKPVMWINKSDYLNAGGTLIPYDEDICWFEEGCFTTNKGPITALNYLENQTSGWTNIEAKEYTLTDSVYGSITRTNARARMLTETEADSTNAHVWAYGNLYEPESKVGYWLSSADSKSKINAWIIANDGYEENDVYLSAEECGISFGVRPVIELSKN